MNRAPTPLAELTEREWDSQLFGSKIGLAVTLGWTSYHTLRSKGSASGFPDRVCVRERVLYAELKTEKGKPSERQVAWLDGLAAAGAECYLWRPSDLDEIGRVLGSRLGFTSGRMLVNPRIQPWRPRSLWVGGGTYGDLLANELARSA